MAQHVKILGILHIIYAGLALFAGIAVLAVTGGIAGVLSATGRPADIDVAPSIIGLIGVGISIFLIVSC